MVSLYLVSALDYGFGWSYVPAIVSLIANAFVLLGFAGIFWTFRENAYAAATVRVERGQPVISTGAYALVRHPMYAAALPLFVATPPALGSWYGLIPAAVVAATIVWRLLDEERHLARDLPGYTDYRAKVRSRLVPRRVVNAAVTAVRGAAASPRRSAADDSRSARKRTLRPSAAAHGRRGR